MREDFFSDYFLTVFCEDCSHSQKVEIMRPVLGVGEGGEPILLDGLAGSRADFCDRCDSGQVVVLGYSYEPDTTVY